MSESRENRRSSEDPHELNACSEPTLLQRTKLNRFEKAAILPKICNLNPRSLYNKTDEFHTLVEQEELDVIFISESWERENKSLKDIINLEDHEVFSNVSQRKGSGGRPAIVANVKKYNVENVTNKLIQVPWGVEAVWCVLTPKNTRQKSNIKKIACCAIYFKPSSKKKTLFLDHISDGFNILNTKYSEGLEFILSGDTNHLQLGPILSLSPRMNQIVRDWTRLNPPAILDPVIMTLSHLYQQPLCKQPLDVDPDKKGEQSDHRIVIVEPINEIEKQCTRQTEVIKFRPITDSGIEKMKQWFVNNDWNEVFVVENAHDKAQVFQDKLLALYHECFPEKTRKISSDDQPWMSTKLKKLDRKRKRIYRKERKSIKWKVSEKNLSKRNEVGKSGFLQKISQ